MRKQALLTSAITLVSIVFLSVVVLGSKIKNVIKVSDNQTVAETIITADETPVFFYGNTCPHCADVEAWMKESRIEEKISITKKEVYDNQQNAQELTKAAQSCGLPTNNIGVPFLYTEGKCLVGTPDIINYLSEKAGLMNASGSAERNAQ
jgi:glutaredoxin